MSTDGLECIRYGELYTKYGEIIYEVDSKTNLNKEGLVLSEKNDILIPCSGETAIDLATASCVQKDNIAIGGDITIIKTNQHAPFITYYINQKKTEIAKYAQGVSIVHLYPKDFKVMNIRIPSINEQKRIIALLEVITKKEQLLESKYQEYQEFKKYLMQQIFAGKLRFDNEEDWKTVKLGDICKIKTGKLDANAMVENGKYRFYTCAKEYYFIDDYAYDTEALLISGNGAHVGYIHYYKGKFNAYQRTYILDQFTENIKLIMYILDKSLKKRIQQEKNEGNTPYIKLSTLKDMKINLPQSKTEQEKITSLFTDVNNKIDYINIELKNMQNFKKGLLQQMIDNMPLLFKFNIIINE